MLADHLDAALAAGEDLLATRLAALADLDTVEDAFERELSRFVNRLERLEALLVGRILQARRWLEELPQQDADLQPAVRLFVASTESLLDLVEHFGGRAERGFDSGEDRLPFLRQRGLIARDAAGLPIYAAIEVGESYRIGSVLELGPFMDLIATFLDVLDRRYDLYQESDVSADARVEGEPAIVESRPDVTATSSLVDTTHVRTEAPFEKGKPIADANPTLEPAHPNQLLG